MTKKMAMYISVSVFVYDLYGKLLKHTYRFYSAGIYSGDKFFQLYYV